MKLQPQNEVDRGLPVAIVALAAIPLIVFAVFLVGQIGTSKPSRPASQLVDIKPDAVYRELPVTVATAAPSPDPNIIYFAPTTAELPVPVSMPEPTYTDEARKAQVQGPMKVLIKIGASGNVSDPQILTPLGHGLEERALRAVIDWRFRPARMAGKPIPSSAYIDLHFK